MISIQKSRHFRVVFFFGGRIQPTKEAPSTYKKRSTEKGPAWNPKHPFINGCFNWMIPNLYIGNGCFTKHPFINGCLGFQVDMSGFFFGPFWGLGTGSFLSTYPEAKKETTCFLSCYIPCLDNIWLS